MIRKTENINLKGYNSFGVDTSADLLVEWDSVESLVEWLRSEGKELVKGRWDILG